MTTVVEAPDVKRLRDVEVAERWYWLVPDGIVCLY